MRCFAVLRTQSGSQHGDGLQWRAEFVGDVGNQLSRGRQLFAAEQLFAHGMLLLQLERGGDLIGQMLHGGLLALAEIVEPFGVQDRQHAHQFGLREHGNQEHRARRYRGFFPAEVRTAAGIRNRQHGIATEAGRDSGGDGTARRLGIDDVHRRTPGIKALQEFASTIVDVETDAGSVGKRCETHR